MGKGLLGLRKGKTVEPVKVSKPVKHSEACEFASACYEQFSAVRPNHCKRCHGHGNTGKQEDPSVGMFNLAPCPDCIEQGLCPICGHQHGEGWEGYRCENSECGWDEDDERTHSPYADCECGWHEFEAAEAEAGYNSYQFFVEGENDYPGAGEEDFSQVEYDGAQSDFWYDFYKGK